jgi:fimbrial chaperone protein
MMSSLSLFKSTLIAAAFAMSLLAASGASAMSVEPMLLDLASVGKTAQQSFRVANNGAAAIPVEIAVSRIELGPNGEQSGQPAGKEFLIYPPQAIIPAGASQVFRVQWIGEPDLAKSRSYRFDVAQVPVKLSKEQSGIQIVMNFGVTVNVAPPGAKSDIQVIGAAPVVGKDGKRLASLTVKNPGSKHAYLRQSVIDLSGGGWSAQMTSSTFTQQVGLGVIQPGKERRFILPIEVPAGVSAIKASVKYDPGMR